MAELAGSQPLSRHTVLETSDVEVAQAKLAATYGGDVTMRPLSRNSSFSVRLNAAPVGRLMITSTQWGAAAEFDVPADGHFNFVSVLHGRGAARLGQRVVDMTPERGVALAPMHPVIGEVCEGQIALGITIPQDVVEAHLRSLTGKDTSQPLDFQANMLLKGRAASASAWRLVHYVVGELERDPSLLSNPLITERFADTLLTSLLCCQPNNYSQWLQREARAAEPRYVRLVEEYLEAHCDQPITARDLAEIAGVSMSALYAGFKRHRGCAPLKFLEEIRLRRVRDALLLGLPGTTVKDVGLRWGFSSPSGLSRAYGRRFGETPSETLQRSAKRH